MLFPEARLAQAGSKISQLIKSADANPQTQSKVAALMQKHFGTTSDPNMNLIPNAPAAEKGGILRLLKKEITAQAGDLDHSPTLAEIQKWKSGSGSKGRFDRSITNSQQRLYQNISTAYGNVLREAIPEIAKPYTEYAKASQALEKHGGGIAGLAHTMLTGGGAGGWMMRQAFLYPTIERGLATVGNAVSATQPKQGRQNKRLMFHNYD